LRNITYKARPGLTCLFAKPGLKKAYSLADIGDLSFVRPSSANPFHFPSTSLLLHLNRLQADVHYPAHIQILSLLHHQPTLGANGYHSHLGTEVGVDSTAAAVVGNNNLPVVADSNYSPAVVAGSNCLLAAFPNHDGRGDARHGGGHDDPNRDVRDRPNHHPQMLRMKTIRLSLSIESNKVLFSWHYSYLVIVNVIK
jgi:hypothetical protein